MRIILIVSLLLFGVFIPSTIIYSIVSLKNGYAASDAIYTNDWVLLGGIGSDTVTFRIRLLTTRSNDAVFAMELFQDQAKPTILSIHIKDGSYNVTTNHCTDNSTDSSNNNTCITNDHVTVIKVWEEEVQRGTSLESIWNVQIHNLQSQRNYQYTIRNDARTMSGAFPTVAPVGRRFNFSILAAGCAQTGSNHAIFESMFQDVATTTAAPPVVQMIHLGDFHYEDIAAAAMRVRLNAISQVLSSPRQRKLYQNIPLTYMWDDHDWLGNDSGNATSRTTNGPTVALQSYQIAFPHYPLAAADNTDNTTDNNATTTNNDTTTIIQPISPYHAYTIGTVRFVITDLRSECTRESIYSPPQKEWLYQELRNASAYDYVVWITTKPWIGTAEPGDDAWFGYAPDRTELSDYITNTVTTQNLLVVSADAHMIALDDGRNTYYGTNTTSPSFPLLQTGPLDRIGSSKGGPFSHGCYAYKRERTNQYSKITFSFLQEPCIHIESYRVKENHRARFTKETVLQHTLCGTRIFYTPQQQRQDQRSSSSCDIATFDPASSLLLYISCAITFLSMILPCVYLLMAQPQQSQESLPQQQGYGSYCFGCSIRYEFILIGFIILLGFIFTIGFGIGIPYMQKIPQYTLRPYSIIGLTQSITILLVILYAIRSSRITATNKNTPETSSTQKNEEEDGDDSNHGSN